MPWIFAYGSLMWDFDCDHEERTSGVLDGFHRSFNKKSTRNWGTADAPGPVLGLEPGGECVGVVFRVDADSSGRVVTKIDEREGPSYRARAESVRLPDGRTVTAKVWINDRSASTYIGDKSRTERARMANTASGENGSAAEYVFETRRKLRELDIEDPSVENFARRVSELSN